MSYNLSSPNGILEPCVLEHPNSWFEKELAQIVDVNQRAILERVARDLTSFVRWPSKALLFWPGCDRVPESVHKPKYFRYPMYLKDIARSAGIKLDTRVNGPAIASFLLAGGERPKRFGSSNAWSIHHLYSGKFPYYGQQTTKHAAKDCNHFTQSAGLVATHPIADALMDEFPFFAWLLRCQARIRFGYDPDRVFGSETNDLGFVPGYPYTVVTPPDLLATS